MVNRVVAVFVMVTELQAVDVGGELVLNLKDEKVLSPFSPSWLCPGGGSQGAFGGESNRGSGSQRGCGNSNQFDGFRSVHSSEEDGNCPSSR